MAIGAIGGPMGLGGGLNPTSFFSGGFGVDTTGLTGPSNPLGSSTAASGGLGIGTGLGIASAAFSLSKGINPDDPIGIAKQAAAVGSLIPGAGMIFAGIGLGLNVVEG